MTATLSRCALVCIAVLTIVTNTDRSRPVYAAESPDDTAESSGADADALTTKKEMAAVLGQSAGSDFVAKHFTLLFGGVVLNQFDVRTEGTGADERFFLEDGSAEAKAFLEGGFRWRWAWLERDSILQATMRGSDLALFTPPNPNAAAEPEKTKRIIALEHRIRRARNEVSKQIAARRAAQLALKAAEASAAAETAAAVPSEEKAESGESTKLPTGTAKREAPKVEEPAADENSVITAAVNLAKARVAESKAREELKQAANDLLDETGLGDTGQAARYFSLSSRIKEKKAFALLPDDWGVRFGFVFDAGTSSENPVTAVGGSDIYGELGFGWNLVRWSFDTGSRAEAPVRGSINLDMDGLFFTDEQIGDVHGRGIFGLAFVFGLPVTYSEPDPSDLPDPSTVQNDPVIEVLARIGAVYAETPAFLDSRTDELKQEHGNVLYSGNWGGGLDLELNVPITQKLGYLMARGQINFGFDPNPWFISLGYTIPLSTLLSGITSGG